MVKRKRNSAGLYFVNSSSSVLSVFLSMAILIWVNQYLLRRISPNEYALVPVIISLMIFLEFFRIVFTRGILRSMVEADARGDDTGVTRVVSSMLPVLLLVATVIGLFGAIGVVYIDRIIEVEPEYIGSARLMLGVLLLELCLAIATTPMAAGLHVHLRFLELNLLTLAKEVVRGALLVSLLAFAGPSAIWVPVASTTAGLMLMAILVAVTWKILPSARFRRSMIDMATVRDLLNFSLWTSVQGINMFAQRAAPVLFLNRFGSSIDVASFYVGNLPNLQIRKLTQAAANPATPSLTALYATDGETALQDFYYRGGRYHLWGALFLVPPLVVFAEPLIEMYAGSTYIDAALVMVLIFSAYPFNYAGAMFYQIAFATGRIKSYNICSVGMAVVAMAAMYYFTAIKGWGASGAALGMALGFGVSQVFIIWPFGLKMVKGRWSLFFTQVLLPGLFPSVAALLACWAFGEVVSIDNWLRFGIGCLLSAIVFVSVMVGFCLDPQDRQMADRALRKVTAWFRR